MSSLQELAVEAITTEIRERLEDINADDIVAKHLPDMDVRYIESVADLIETATATITLGWPE